MITRAVVVTVSGPLTVLQQGAATAVPATSATSQTLTVGAAVLVAVLPDGSLSVLGLETTP